MSKPKEPRPLNPLIGERPFAADIYAALDTERPFAAAESAEAAAADATPAGIVNALDSLDAVVTEDDGEISESSPPLTNFERLSVSADPLYYPDARLSGVNIIEARLLDEVAVQLFVKGWPLDDIYNRAQMFLRVRAAHLSGKPYTSQKPVPFQKGIPKR